MPTEPERVPQAEDLTEPKQPGKFITVMGRHLFIPEGNKLEDVFDPKKTRDSAQEKSPANKASYMTATQESPVKLDLQTAPHYVMTANELHTSQFTARVGEEVRYDYGTKKGILITVDRSFAKILNDTRTGYEFAHISDVHKSDEFTVFGRWIDIPDKFKNWMLRKAKVGDPDRYIHKEWNQLPKELRAVLRDESVFEVTQRTGQHANPSAITDYDGAEETEHEKRKHADGKNPHHKELPGLSGNLKNPQDNKRRDGRQFPDNEEQNNTFSAGEEKPTEPYSVNITGGTSSTTDYGTQLSDWRFATPKPSKDVEQDIKPREKVDSGASSISGENQPLSENPHEIKEKTTFGIPQPYVSYGVKYMSEAEAKKFLEKQKKRVQDG